MSLQCRYTFPIQGPIHIESALSFYINDLYLEFFVENGELQRLCITFPVEKASAEESEKHKNSSFWVHEPRAHELEEVVLKIGSGFSMATSKQVNIPFSSRGIEWIEDGVVSSIVVNLQGGPQKEEKTNPITVPLFIRSVLIGCIQKRHDPALTFYKRGADDALSHRYIEAIYNFYFFLEYLYGNGKFKQNQVIAEFNKSDELCSAIDSVKKDETLIELASQEFMEMVSSASKSEVFRHIVRTRGKLHHPTRKGINSWHPEKQGRFANEAIFLHLVCLNIAIRRYYEQALSVPIEKAYQKVQRCLRRKSDIRVVTK